MITKNIKSIGIELEGCTNEYDFDELHNYINNKNEKYIKISGDGSIRTTPVNPIDIEVKIWNNNLNDFYEMVEYCFGFIEQNKSCGNHIHFKFKDDKKAFNLFGFKFVWNLFEKMYMQHLNQRFKTNSARKQKYASRLTNPYCENKYDLNGTIAEYTYLHNKSIGKTLCRYKMINIKSFYKHKTLEIRLLPYFTSITELKLSVNWLISTIDKIYSANTIKLLDTTDIDIDTTISEIKPISIHNYRVKTSKKKQSPAIENYCVDTNQTITNLKKMGLVI